MKSVCICVCVCIPDCLTSLRAQTFLCYFMHTLYFMSSHQCVCSCVFLQAYGVGGMRKRQEPPAIEDRDKPYVCDSEHGHFVSLHLLLTLSDKAKQPVTIFIKMNVL